MIIGSIDSMDSMGSMLMLTWKVYMACMCTCLQHNPCCSYTADPSHVRQHQVVSQQAAVLCIDRYVAAQR